MINKVDITDFKKAFADAGRAEQFSEEGLEALFDYLTELENDMGSEIELDVITLCCDFVENTIDEALEDTGCRSLNKLRENTSVITVDEANIIYQAF